MNEQPCPWFDPHPVPHEWVPLERRGAVAQRRVWCDTWMLPTTPAATMRMDTENAIIKASYALVEEQTE